MYKHLLLVIASIVLGATAMAGHTATNDPAQTTAETKKEKAMNPVVIMETSLGTIKIELLQD